MTREEKINQYVKANGKSAVFAFLLALLLGPFGYLYVNVVGGLIMILIVMVGRVAGGGDTAQGLLIILWVISFIMAPIQVRAKNKALLAQADLMAPDNP
jgi:hypothetical protein